MSQKQSAQPRDMIAEFRAERAERIRENAGNTALQDAALAFTVESARVKYSYNFTWMGRPIIQYPQDMIALQELVWESRPDVIIETGIAHGGSLVYSASLLTLLGGDGYVVGVDIDIRAHNRREIEAHPMFPRIRMIQASSVEESTRDHVAGIIQGRQKPMLLLDSNHTHAHVLRELQLYSPLVRKGGWIIVFDTAVERMPGDFYPDRPWSRGDNPMTAVDAFLAENDRFERDADMDAKLCISMAPRGYLRCVKD
jgi:cephalosporin hydroxylase